MRIFFSAGFALACTGLISCGFALQAKTSPSVAEVKEVRSLRGACPPNYVWVPGNPTPGLGSVANIDGVPSFCIAKFEMKHPTDVTGKGRSIRDNNAVPVSQTQSKPWTGITRNEARAVCERVKISGFKVALISNGEWQTVARNMESTAANWQYGDVGQGTVARGHSDNWPSESLPVIVDADPYDGTDSRLQYWDQKRTHQLSTGEVVWDLSGNVWEWVNDDVAELGMDWADGAWLGQLDKYVTLLSERNSILFGPLGEKFASDDNLGYFSTFNGSRVLRGGSWHDDYKAGMFSAHVGDGLVKEYSSDIGFRCVARPVR